ncbi:MAG: dihydroneopterin aldolase [Armatimonadota bacterium]|nr:dihydroneopterin aldolase [Armatimonadota bacterium]
MDKIIIKDILARCIIGVNEEERRERQDVVINIALETDLSRAGKTDDFKDAIDYRDVKKRVVNATENSRYFLLEALAERIAEICLEHQAVVQVQVSVEKPGALRFARSVGIEITRNRV